MQYTLKIEQPAVGRMSWKALYGALDKLAIGDSLTVELDSPKHSAARTIVHHYASKRDYEAQGWKFTTQARGKFLTIRKTAQRHR